MWKDETSNQDFVEKHLEVNRVSSLFWDVMDEGNMGS